MSNTRTISPELLAHLQSGATTTTILIRIDPQDTKFDSVGITKLDRDVIYDDGAGELTYSAAVGMVPAELVTGESMDVGNSEFANLLPQFSIPICRQPSFPPCKNLKTDCSSSRIRRAFSNNASFRSRCCSSFA